MINVNIETVSLRSSVCKRRRDREKKMEWRRIHGFDFFFADFALRSVSVGRWHTLQKKNRIKMKNERWKKKYKNLVIWCQRTVPNVENVQFIDASDNKTVVNLFLIFFSLFFLISFLNLIAVLRLISVRSSYRAMQWLFVLV